jgi:hypothetical protein
MKKKSQSFKITRYLPTVYKLTIIKIIQLRNTMENLTCATVKGSAVDMYFRRQVELSNMYRTMESNNYNTAEQAIEDVKIGYDNSIILNFRLKGVLGS